jgi:uroporphyrinogen decarboxylase
MMRQAGRYLPEYREVREKIGFFELCANAELAAEVSLQPFRRFGTDAVIMFSDILVPLRAMGMEVEMAEGGPRLPHPIASMADVGKLHGFDAAKSTPYVLEVVQRLREAAGDQAAVLTFAGAPWTLACYMIEGGGSKSFSTIKAMLAHDPQTLEALLQLLAETIGEFLASQVEVGAQALQLFDTWAGELSPEDYRRWALPFERRVFQIARRKNAPGILYINGCAGLLEDMATSGADVLSIDWRIELTEARRRVPAFALQGNLDPAALLAPPRVVKRRTRTTIDSLGGQAHILNLGHGILPTTPVECAETFVQTARTWHGIAVPEMEALP